MIKKSSFKSANSPSNVSTELFLIILKGRSQGNTCIFQCPPLSAHYCGTLSSFLSALIPSPQLAHQTVQAGSQIESFNKRANFSVNCSCTDNLAPGEFRGSDVSSRPLLSLLKQITTKLSGQKHSSGGAKPGPCSSPHSASDKPSAWDLSFGIWTLLNTSLKSLGSPTCHKEALQKDLGI